MILYCFNSGYEIEFFTNGKNYFLNIFDSKYYVDYFYKNFKHQAVGNIVYDGFAK